MRGQSLFYLLITCTLWCGMSFAQEEDDFLLDDLEAEFAEPAGSTVDDEKSVKSGTKDPLRSFNKVMFTVNDRLYFWVLKPTGKGWGKVVPKPARRGFRNFFANLRAPGRTVNALLQGKWGKAGDELERFTVNTTFGFLGFDDAATEGGTAAPSPEDVGQTLAVYRCRSGCYVVWPIFGPSTLRDSIGMIGDKALDPVTYTGNASFPIGVGEVVNKTSLSIGQYEELKRDALDPYSFLRDAYLQNREKRVKE